ncbi:MAG: YfhO family protein [Bacteroidota bacterium]|nr:YfhO family protein [Bacteroidota bacterium]MDP4234700.1 YfhO family protein [Bacteroidota bacterium]MDP4243924.1 YfhO family protein [Bacteroidota bacterium]MDP4288854.1 YfhO family protein [Bacteroidota bacterium]
MRRIPQNMPLKRHILSILLLLGVLVIAFGPILFQGKLLLPTDLGDTMTLPFSQSFSPPQAENAYISDGLFQFYPYKLLLREAWQHGRFAFWNPLNLGGYPAYAESMATNFDVLNVVLLFGKMPFVFEIYLILPLFIAGIAFYFFLMSYNIDIWVARIFSMSYMLCGVFITHLLNHFIAGSMCWAPLLALFIKRHYDEGSARYLVFASLALCFGFLGGNIQTASFLVFLLALYALSYPKKETSISRRFGVITKTIALGLLLSAIMWLPTLEFFWSVVQSGLIASTSYTRGYSILQRILTLPLMLTFFIPQLAGSAGGVTLYNAFGVYTVDFNAAIGYLPLLLGIWAVIARWRDSDVRPFALLTVCGFLLPIATPLFRFLYHRFFIIGIFGLCGAGALGFQRILDGDLDRTAFQRWVRISRNIFAAAAGLILIVGFLILTNYQRTWEWALTHLLPRIEHMSFAEGNRAWVFDRLRATIDNYSLSSPSLFISLASIAIGYYLLSSLLHSSGLKRNAKLAGIWAITGLQVGMFAYSWFPHVDPARFPLLPDVKLTDFLRRDSSTRVFVDRRWHPNEQYLFIDNDNAAYGIAMLSGYESLLTRSFYLHIPKLATDSTMPAKMLGLLNVKYVLTGATSHLPSGDFALLDTGTWRLWQNRHVTLRAWLSDRVVNSPSDSSTLAQLVDTSFDLREVIFKDEKYAAIPPPLVMAPQLPTIIEDKPELIRIETSSDHSGYLVLSDSYYPGWECFVDGRKHDILRANYAMRAVYLDAGRHHVSFVFDPMSFQLGKWISILSFASILGLGLVQATRRERRP